MRTLMMALIFALSSVGDAAEPRVGVSAVEQWYQVPRSVSSRLVQRSAEVARFIPESEGFRIVRIEAESAFAKVGLQNDDVLVMRGRKAILSEDDLEDVVADFARRGSLDLSVRRAGGTVLLHLQFVGAGVKLPKRDERGWPSVKVVTAEELAQAEARVGPRWSCFPSSQLETMMITPHRTVHGGDMDGLLMKEVDPEGTLFRRGLREGDVVTSVNGMPLTSRTEALAAYAELGGLDLCSYVVRRDGFDQVVEVDLRQIPPPPVPEPATTPVVEEDSEEPVDEESSSGEMSEDIP